MEIRRLKEIVANNQLKEKERVEACINNLENLELEKARNKLEDAKSQQQDVVEIGKVIREKELIDCYHLEANSEENNQVKIRKN